jgi:NAD(P)-dependent dehydrogenase (short-subunit alcohol dehydrogenase family)
MTAQKIVLVTGSSRGIGAATARLAAAQGYDVAVNYTRDEAGASAVVADVEKAGRRAVAIRADVSREDDVARLFATIDQGLGRLTDLVYNAGITGPASRVENLSTEAVREILDVNVLGAVLTVRAAIPRLSKAQGGPGGAIVLLSSAMATLGGAGEYVMYSASKGAVESLSIGLARELATEGIRVNVVEPGPTDTGIHPPGRLERLSKVVPLGRPGTPEEIAEAVMFLLSDRSSFTTGAVLRVAGGR